MVKRAIALFLLVNVIGVAANLPRIIQALDGAELGDRVGRWAVGVGTATGDLLDEARTDELTPEDVAQIQEDLRNDALDDPLDDESVAALVDLWRVLEETGAQLQADDLRNLLLDEGIDPEDAHPTITPSDDSIGGDLSPSATDGFLDDAGFLEDDRGRTALEALESGTPSDG